VNGVGGAHPDAEDDAAAGSPWHRTTDACLGRARNPALADPAKAGGGRASELCIVARGRADRGG
jgi:hypothetical protein